MTKRNAGAEVFVPRILQAFAVFFAQGGPNPLNSGDNFGGISVRERGVCKLNPDFMTQTPDDRAYPALVPSVAGNDQSKGARVWFPSRARALVGEVHDHALAGRPSDTEACDPVKRATRSFAAILKNPCLPMRTFGNGYSKRIDRFPISTLDI
jgi:hypothetical protein